MSLTRPSSIERANQELLRLLIAIQNLSGKTGSIAEKVAKILHPHMEKEEQIVLPLVSFLPLLARGRPISRYKKRAALLYSRMKKEFPEMVSAHKEISKSVSELKKVGSEEGHLTAVRFAEMLEEHSHEEEEIIYPAAMLVGRVMSGSPK